MIHFPQLSLRLLLCVCLIISASDSLTVTTPYGRVTGNIDPATLVASFLGVPYVAEQPLGALRFTKMSLPPTNSSFQIDATAFPPPCIQWDLLAGSPPRMPVNASEACLFLNVFTPSVNPNMALPVMVFVHGGGFQFGQSSEYPGWDLAASTKSVVVTIQYRLNLFGFLTLPSAGVQTNLGLLDQQIALQWIQSAIPAFGGDPNKVVLFGQSAGGASVSFHLIMKPSWSLFHAAVLESPGQSYFWLTPQLENYTLYAAPSHINCSSSDPDLLLTCLRALNASSLLDLSALINAAPSVDGDVVVAQPLLAWQNSTLVKPNATVILGSTSFEGLFILWTFMGLQTSLTAEIFWEALVGVLADGPFLSLSNSDRSDPVVLQRLALTVSSWYNVTSETTSNMTGTQLFDSLARIFGDYLLTCYACGLASASVPHMRLYRYWFTHNVTWMAPWPNTHACELGYVFHSQDVFGTRFSSLAEVALASMMGRAFSSISTSTVPLLDPSLHWPLYAFNRSLVVLDTPPRSSTEQQGSPCPSGGVCTNWWNLVNEK